MLRDFRINRIFEGSSEIMRLFIAREAVDTHLAVAGELINPKATTADKANAFAKAGAFYAGWLPKQYVGWGRWPRYGEFGVLAKHLRYVERSSRKLARSMFYAMSRYQAKLERKQALLGRFVDIGAELYAMSASVVRAHSLASAANDDKAIRMADVFCRQSRLRVEQLFDRLFENADNATYRLAQEVVRGEHEWLEQGALPVIDGGVSVAPGRNGAARQERDREISQTRETTQMGASG